MTLVHARRWSAAILAVFVAGSVLHAQPKPQTATEFYKQYLASFAKATKLEDITSYWAADRVKQLNQMPAAQRPQAFEMIKGLGTMYTNVAVVKEDKNADGSVTLSLTALDSDKKKATGKANILKEGGAWKVGEESWSS
jgi:hypothetical protein